MTAQFRIKVSFCLLASSLLPSCEHQCSVSLISTVVSPDHTFNVIAYSCNRSVTDYPVEVSLLPLGVQPSGLGNIARFGHFDEHGFKKQGDSFLRIRWIDLKHLEIAYPHGTRVSGPTFWMPIPADEVRTIRITYRPDPPEREPVLVHLPAPSGHVTCTPGLGCQ